MAKYKVGTSLNRVSANCQLAITLTIIKRVRGKFICQLTASDYCNVCSGGDFVSYVRATNDPKKLFARFWQQQWLIAKANVWSPLAYANYWYDVVLAHVNYPMGCDGIIPTCHDNDGPSFMPRGSDYYNNEPVFVGKPTKDHEFMCCVCGSCTTG